MSRTYIFPCLSILLNLGSASFYAYEGDLNRTIYWLAAATLTVCVTLR